MGNKTQKLLAPLLFGIFALGIAFFSATANLYAAVTTPATINYQGRLLSAANVPLAGNYTFRFSVWNTSDWVGGDTDGFGAVNVGSAGYAGWQETHAVTIAAGDFGLFNMNLGDTTPFPSFDAATHKNLQVEVKVTGALDTTYEILDPAGTLADANDRKPLENQAFAQNADTLDNLDAPSMLRSDVSDNYTSGTLTFDNGTTLTANGTVNLGDNGDAVAINSNTWDINAAGVASGLTGLTSTGSVDFSGTSAFRIREVASAALATCTTVKEIVLDTTANKIYVCTVVGAPGTWVSSVPASGDFEAVYAADALSDLDTANGPFTINTGTGDFIVASNDWSVDATGNATFGGTVNGVNLAAIPFANLATRVKEAVFSPDYAGSASFLDGTANNGKLELNFEDLGGTGKRNFYEWTTSKAAIQDIDVVASFQLPLDFVSFTASPLTVGYQTFNAVAATNKVDVSMYDTAGTAVALVGGGSLASAAWANAAITFGGAPTFTAGDTVTFRIKLSSTNAGFARISDLVLNYNGR